MTCCERDPEQREHKHILGNSHAAESDNAWRTPTLSEVLAIMREARAIRVKMPNGLEVELSPLAFALPTKEETYPPAPVGIENGGEPTDEQLLQWSAPGPLPAAIQPEADGWPARDNPERA